MTFDEERIALETWFNDRWTETAIKWPNVKLTTSSLDEWVCMTIVYDENKVAQMGANDTQQYRYYGMIAFQVFTRPAIGPRRADILATAISDIWRDPSIDFITVWPSKRVNLGIVESWYQVDIIVPYFRDDYKQISQL